MRARRRNREDAAELARAYAELLSPPLIVEETDLVEGLRLFERLPQLGSFDAVPTAAAQSAGASALVSADAAYGAVPHLHHVVPDDRGVKTLLNE